MLALDDSSWRSLSHACGGATDIPDLLARGRSDFTPGHEEGSTWFELWSALCHQGDAYSASYAALPHLIALAPEHLQRKHYDPLFLAACIGLARLERRGPTLPAELALAYQDAVDQGRTLAEANAGRAWDADSDAVMRASVAALSGDVAGARQILDSDLHQ